MPFERLNGAYVGLGGTLRTAMPIRERTMSTWLPGKTVSLGDELIEDLAKQNNSRGLSHVRTGLGIESLAVPIEAP